MLRIEFERRKRRWTQGELALKSKLSQSAVALAEKGEAGEDALEAFSNALRLGPPHILLKEVHPKADPEETVWR